MAVSQEIIENVKQVRNAAYGKDVREAIAKGLELCYGYTSGETAIEAAERANAAAEAVEGIMDDATETIEDLRRAVANVDDIVKVSETQPTEAENKIWIQPQQDTEYKIASFAAYEALWNRMKEVVETYQQGHGGIVSIVQDTTYSDPEDELKRRFVVTYSDGTTSEFFVKDGPTGPIGPLDQIKGTVIYYYRMASNAFVPTPPTDGWTTSIPTMSAGDYLWTQTVITYESNAEAYIYGLTRWGQNGRDGVDGTGAVHSVKIGDSGTKLVGDIVIPVDSEPTHNSTNLLLSGGIHAALQSYAKNESPAFTGAPTATTATAGDSSTRIATTQFVANSLSKSSLRKAQITMTSNTVTYLDSSITENTYCMFAYINSDTPFNVLQWKTEAGKLTITGDRTPESETTFEVILTETANRA